jgi:hypothetical protein
MRAIHQLKFIRLLVVAFGLLRLAAYAQEPRISNLAIRAETSPGKPLIIGFTIGPGANKTVLVRAVGPTLRAFGVSSPLADPRLEVFSAEGRLLAENENHATTDAAVAAQVGAFELPPGSKDAAIVVRLSPGGHTVHVTDSAGRAGTALVEVYEVGATGAPLTNLSARNYANVGTENLIAGFSIIGSGPKRVLVRGIGPTLTSFGVAGALTDPKVEVYSGGQRIADNDQWSSSLSYAFGLAGAFPLTAASRDAALELSLSPGGYTAHVTPATGSGGEALVEIYERPYVKIQSMNVPESAPSPSVPKQQIQLQDLVGTYRRTPYENGAHAGSISFRPGSTNMLQWKNDGGWNVGLEPDLANDRLKTDNANPYYNDPYNYGLDIARNFRLEFQGGEFIGFRFLYDLFVKEGKRAVTPLPTGLYSYISMSPAESPAGYGAGLSYYTTIWPMLEKPLDRFQLGLPATWIHPDNPRDFNQPLLPPDNPIRIAYPNAGPAWWGLWQTIEGSPGYWGGTQFPSTMAKYLMGPNPEGYTVAPNTPGFGWINGVLGALPIEKMSLAQISNRLIIPPDGFTFHRSSTGEFLGVAWMTLPLTNAKTTAPVPVGDHSWTFFMNTDNFRGPIAFVVPDAWTRLSTRWAPSVGRGLDAQLGVALGASMEINTVPGYESADRNGTRYSRIPRLQFPTSQDGVSYLIADWTTYSKDALFTPVKDWFEGRRSASGKFAAAGSHKPTLKPESFFAFQDHKMTIPISGWDSFVKGVVFPTPGGGTAFGLRWNGKGTPGVLPEYYRANTGSITAIEPREVPEETGLHRLSFPEPLRNKPYTSPVGGADGWDTPAPVSGPHKVKLNDGSTVTYYWYRFIDQPALKGFNWSAAERSQLQHRVEQIHRAWANTPEFMAPPTVGALVRLDEAQLVTPPPGLEFGYVPFVTQQEN